MRRETTGSQSFRIGVSVCRHSGPKPPQSATTKPRGAYFTNDRLPHSTPLSQRIRIRTDTLTRARTLSPPYSRRCGRKRDAAREAYLSETSSSGPVGEMKLDHLYWVVSRWRRSVFDGGSQNISYDTLITVRGLNRKCGHMYKILINYLCHILVKNIFVIFWYSNI